MAKHLTSALVILAIAFATIFFVYSYNPHGNSIGAVDYIQYYSALRIILENNNPYDPSVMQAMQISLGKPENQTVMSWNPPWTYLVLAPFCLIPFRFAVPVWLLLNLFFLIGSISLVYKVYKSQNTEISSSKLILFSFFYLPAFSCLSFGQTGLFMSFIFCLFLFLLKKRKYVVAGMILSLLSIKPHLFYLLAPLILIWSFQNKNFKLLQGIILAAVILLVTTYALSAQSVHSWIDAIVAPSQIKHGQNILDWKVATLVGFIKTLINERTNTVPKWPMWFIPLSGLLLYSGFLMRKKLKISIKNHAPITLALSIFTAPYGWFFDQAILICLHSSLVLKGLEEKNKLLLSALFTLQACLILYRVFPFSAQHHYFWFPLALICVWFFAYFPGKKTNE